MKVSLQLFANLVAEKIKDFEVEVTSDEVEMRATLILEEISEVVKDYELSDFDAMEKIVQIFEKYKVSAGVRHDF